MELTHADLFEVSPGGKYGASPQAVHDTSPAARPHGDGQHPMDEASRAFHARYGSVLRGIHPETLGRLRYAGVDHAGDVDYAFSRAVVVSHIVAGRDPDLMRVPAGISRDFTARLAHRLGRGVLPAEGNAHQLHDARDLPSLEAALRSQPQGTQVIAAIGWVNQRQVLTVKPFVLVNFRDQVFGINPMGGGSGARSWPHDALVVFTYTTNGIQPGTAVGNR